MPDNWQEAGFGLYLHWPFCQSKCPYCDFNSHVAAQIDQSAWQEAYISEIRRYGAETKGRVLSSVFFGGGTPSLMSPDLISTILTEISNTWNISNDIEITLEANPSSVEAGRFAAYRQAGVNRVSLGVQALSDKDLSSLGRLHSVAEARKAIEVAKAHFNRVSFDLIYARQNQTLDAWRAELTEALILAAGHLSLYQLTIEPGTAFGSRHAVGRLPGLPKDDTAADMYSLTQELCDAAGLPAYETSNHATESHESRHNLIYWRGGDYVGIGPGAHGRLTIDGTRIGTTTELTPSIWLNHVRDRGNGDAEREIISTPERAVEYAMMCLRLSEGLDLDRFHRMSGAFNDQGLASVLDLGMVEKTDDRLRLTEKGRPVLNAVLRELLA